MIIVPELVPGNAALVGYSWIVSGHWTAQAQAGGVTQAAVGPPPK